eukprot:203208-Rhodomonas_salina.4
MSPIEFLPGRLDAEPVNCARRTRGTQARGKPFRCRMCSWHTSSRTGDMALRSAYTSDMRNGANETFPFASVATQVAGRVAYL